MQSGMLRRSVVTLVLLFCLLAPVSSPVAAQAPAGFMLLLEVDAHASDRTVAPGEVFRVDAEVRATCLLGSGSGEILDVGTLADPTFSVFHEASSDAAWIEMLVEGGRHTVAFTAAECLQARDQSFHVTTVGKVRADAPAFTFSIVALRLTVDGSGETRSAVQVQAGFGGDYEAVASPVLFEVGRNAPLSIPVTVHNAANGAIVVETRAATTSLPDTEIVLPPPQTLPPGTEGGSTRTWYLEAKTGAPAGSVEVLSIDLDARSVDDLASRLGPKRIDVVLHVLEDEGAGAAPAGELPSPGLVTATSLLLAIAAFLRRRIT